MPNRAAASRRRKQAFKARQRRLLGGVLPQFNSMDGENVKVMPMDNVYSYFMFLGPLERQKNPRGFNKQVFFAWLLIALNLLFQTTLLYAIFKSIVTGDVVWRDSIISLEGQKSVDPFAPPPSECNPGGSLCSVSNDTFTCAPPSVQLAGRWDILDLDSDGIWTREEVLKAREDLKCQFAVDPLEVFTVFVSFLKKREDVIWLHPLVQSGKALHKHYFDFAKGDIIMCTYRNEEMCPNLLKRGFFDGPLMAGNSPRVGKTIESALNYCYELLKDGGVCERSLPSAYSVWRKSSEQQCLGQEYEKLIYNHPKTGMKKSLLTVNYAAVSDYEKGRRSYLFIAFKSIIILMFILCVVVELNDILIVVTWVLTFPSEEDVDEAVQVTARSTARSTTSQTSAAPSPTGLAAGLAAGERAPSAGDLSVRSTQSEIHAAADNATQHYTIHGITSRHRMMCGCLFFVRFVLAIVLLWVGTVFLLQDTDYVNLLLNGVALVFVIEIANCLYGQLVDQELREKFEETEPFSVSMTSVWKALWFKNAAMRDLFRIACIIGLLCAGMYLHYINIAKPLSKALECACLSQGDHCFEAQEFDTNFWTTYWEHDVPEIFASVKKMKKEHANGVFDSPEPAVASAAANNFIHKGRKSHDKTQEFTTLKVLPSDAEMVPSQLGNGHHHGPRLLNGHHHGTRLLNGHHHRVISLLNDRSV